MLSEPLLAEFLSFLAAILLAATISTTARGVAGNNENPLREFKKFYVDLAGAFTGFIVLRSLCRIRWTK
jgi:hypothetical protein